MRLARRLALALRGNGERWLLGIAAVALAATFLRPIVPLRRAAHEYVVVLDITQSMNVADTRLNGQPASRLDFARQALRRAIPALPCGTRIGWGLFTEYRSFLLFAPVEICANQREILSSLDHIDGRMAWSGNSEVAKGLYGALAIAKGLPSHPAVVFVSDGHEAPPLNPRHRPRFDGKAGEVRGLIVGTGDLTPAPIPKVDQDGKPLGFWKADEVMQTDSYSRGREGSIAGEQLVETEPATPAPAAITTSVGSEHLSSLHEDYLKLLADETGLVYHRLQDADTLADTLRDTRLADATDGWLDLRPLLGAVALAALLMVHAPLRRKSRRTLSASR